jgi:hypothetical protein
MSDELLKKLPRDSYSLPARWLRKLCRLGGLEVIDATDSRAWRFMAMREPPDRPAVDAVLLDSLARLRSEKRSPRRFAVIAPMPPAQTGIANATVQTYRNYRDGIDIFTRFEDIYGYTAFATEEARSEFGFSVYDVGSLPVAVEKHDYAAIVVTLGNSIHNRFIAAQIAHLAAFPPGCPLYLHVHDPWLHDIWAWTALSRGRTAACELTDIYGGRRKERLDRREASRLGATGLAAIMGDTQFAGIIVNSAAAEALVLRELALARNDVPIIRGFHPVFPPTVPLPADRPTSLPLVVGTFGVPGNAKRTEVVHAAAKRLVAQGVVAELVMAGYGISTYLKHTRLDRSFVRVIDAPGDRELQFQMARVDVGVQLRREGLGESSGVVPQLLALERPVVVSSVGSFVELGDAVIQTDASAGPDAIARAILDANAGRDRLRRRSREYGATHTPAQFMRMLESATASNLAGSVRAITSVPLS